MVLPCVYRRRATQCRRAASFESIARSSSQGPICALARHLAPRAATCNIRRSCMAPPPPAHPAASIGKGWQSCCLGTDAAVAPGSRACFVQHFGCGFVLVGLSARLQDVRRHIQISPERLHAVANLALRRRPCKCDSSGQEVVVGASLHFPAHAPASQNTVFGVALPLQHLVCSCAIR